MTEKNNKGDIVIVYELFKRECINVAILKAELENRGYNVIVKNKTEDVYFGKCDLLIVPNNYNTENNDFYKYRFNCKNGKILCLQIEQVVRRDFEDSNKWVAEGDAKKSFFVCWGTNRKQQLLKKGVNKTHIRITGAMQLDQLRKEFDYLWKDRIEIAKEYKIENNKQWLLYISSLSYAKADSPLVIGSANELEEKKLNDIQEFHIKTQKQIIKSINYILHNSDKVFIYRPHTTEEITEELKQLEKEFPDKFYIIKDYNIKQWIVICDMIIMGLSTTSIECYVANKKFLMYVPIKPNMDIVSYFFDNIDIISSFEDFKNVIDSELSKYSMIPKENIDRYYKIFDECSYLKVVDYAIEILSCDCVNETNFNFKRIVYTIKENVLFKVVLKKVYQFLYSCFGFRINASFIKEKFFVNKWEESIEDKKYFNYVYKLIKNKMK